MLIEPIYLGLLAPPPHWHLFLSVCWLINLLYLSAHLFLFTFWLINLLYICVLIESINPGLLAFPSPFLWQSFLFVCWLTNLLYLCAHRINIYRSASTPIELIYLGLLAPPPNFHLFIFVCWLINLLYLSAHIFLFACWLINPLYVCAHRIDKYRSATLPPPPFVLFIFLIADL